MRRLLPLLALLACRPAPSRSLPICPALVTADRAVEADTRQLPADVWLKILVPTFDRPTGTVPPGPHDCSGASLTLTDPALPARPRVAGDLSFAADPDGALLIWARLLDLPDGTAFGPVALVHWTDQGLEIRGVGPLRAPSRRVRLHLEHLARAANGAPRSVLIAEGEACPTGQAPPCPREAVLLPLIAQRFVPAELVEGTRPPRPARIRLDERRDLPGPRRLEIHRRLDLRASPPQIRAALRVRDCPNPQLPESSCSDHLTLDDARPLSLDAHTFSTPEDPWLSFLTTH